ncbi:MAG TPA: hypothetical protein VFH50_03405 [Acidimicrobiales bacterium]|nr:hypothetical protein [Acidimicrobiales bacterium]
MKIALAGIIGRYPYGGVAWCSLMYLLGLRRLGHDVWYLEDTGECNYDPVANTLATDPSYALETIHRTLQPHGFGDRWCYIDYQGGHHGMSESDWRRECRHTDLLVNLSGGCWFWRDEYLAIPHSAFIDSDPAFTQMALAEGVPWYVDFFSRFGSLFTFGSNIGTPASPVPTGGLDWTHTWQPVSLDQWRPRGTADRQRFTTVMTWRIESFQTIGGNKEQEFGPVADIPSRVRAPMEIAINGPGEALGEARRLLEAHEWHTADAFVVSRDAESYRRYIHSSLGEFSVAKSTYVKTNSGWFSDRTECYLAAGRPAVVQDTGFSRHLPTGEGLFAFTDADSAVAGIEAVLADTARHDAVAAELARAHFSDDVVLPPLLERATAD